MLVVMRTRWSLRYDASFGVLLILIIKHDLIPWFQSGRVRETGRRESLCLARLPLSPSMGHLSFSRTATMS